MSLAEDLDSVRRSAICVADEQQVAAAIDSMAVAIERSCLPEPVVLLCVMNGGMIVASELLQRLSGRLTLDYIHASRYQQQLQGAGIAWKALPGETLRGKAVIVVDDIFDEGVTLAAVEAYCLAQGASTVLSAVLVDKRHGRKCNSKGPDVVGLSLPDHYLFGMGMDYKGYLRNSRAIYALTDD